MHFWSTFYSGFKPSQVNADNVSFWNGNAENQFAERKQDTRRHTFEIDFHFIKIALNMKKKEFRNLFWADE